MSTISHFDPLHDTKPIGNYSSSVSIDIGEGELIFISGQVASDNQGNTVGVGDIRKQTHKVFENLQNVLSQYGGQLADIVNTTIYLPDMGLFDEFNEVRNHYFKEHKPSSTLIGVSCLAIRDHLIEISAVAYVQKS
jgi:reactive intermediate/imine deaminase